METIANRVKAIIDRQQQKGIRKYKVSIDDADLTIMQSIEHAQEELADMLVYLEKLKGLIK